MEYNWSVDKIKKHKQYFYNLLKTTEGLTHEDLTMIKEQIKKLNQIEKLMDIKSFEFHLPKMVKYIDKDKLFSRSTYDEYVSVPSEIRKIILNAVNQFQYLSKLCTDTTISHSRLSDRELVELSHDFFKWLPTKNKLYERLFLEYTKPEEHLLKFNNIKSDNLGFSLNFYYPSYTPYLLVNRLHTVEDFSTLNHEIAHGIFFRNDNDITLNSNHFYLTELEGCFFDFLSLEFLKDKLKDKTIDKLNYLNFYSQYENFICFYITNLAIKIVRNRQNISIIPFEEDMLSKELPFYINIDLVINSLLEHPVSDARYLFSYLVSLDLVEIYNSDPEYAFYLFEKIRNNKSNDILTNLRDNNISFMDDNYKSLRKTIKMINNLDNK